MNRTFSGVISLSILLAASFSIVACDPNSAAECTGTIQVTARAGQCYSFSASEQVAGGVTVGDSVCKGQTQVVPAGTYTYSAWSTQESEPRPIGSGEIQVACGETKTVDLNDSNGGPAGDRYQAYACRGNPPTGDVQQVGTSFCKSGEAVVTYNPELLCYQDGQTYKQWAFTCK